MPPEVLEQNPAESPAQPGDGIPASPAAAEPSESEQSPEQKAEAKAKGGVQRRIDELTRKNHEARLEAEFWKTKAMEKPAEPKAEELAKPTKEKPKADDFASYEEYVEKLAEWTADQRYEQRKAEEVKQAKDAERKTEQQQLAEQWKEKEKTLTEKHADYAEVSERGFQQLSELRTPACDVVAAALQQSEIGPELLFHLGENPEKVKELAAMKPLQALMALGKIEATLTGTQPGGSDEKQPPSLTKAPKPPNPVRSSSAAGKPFDPLDPASYGGDFSAYENEMNKRQLRGG